MADTLQDLAAFMDAIAWIESERADPQPIGSGYGALGRVLSDGSRARGRYQIRDIYWSAWATEAGIPGADWRDPAAQDRVAAHKMTQYWYRYRDWRLVAVAWFAGGSVADHAMRHGTIPGGPLVGVSDAVDDYVAKMQRKLAEHKIRRDGGALDPADLKFLVNTPPPVSFTTASRLRAMPSGQAASPVGDLFASTIPELAPAGSTESPLNRPRFDLRRALAGVIDRVSNTIAGGARQRLESLLGGASPDEQGALDAQLGRVSGDTTGDPWRDTEEQG